MPGLSHVEMSVKWTLYWPDGTRKTPSKSHQVDIIRNWTHHLAQALVDQYNEGNNLREVCSLSLPSALALCRANTGPYCLIHPCHSIIIDWNHAC